MCSQTSITSAMSCSTSRSPAPRSATTSLEDLAEPLGLGRVEARRRLVEQQHVELAGQRPGELDEPTLTGGEQRRLPIAQ